MTGFMARSARHFLVIKAARQIKQEIEKAGLDNLKVLANAGKSIVGIYLNGCSADDKAIYRRDMNILLQLGVTPDMLLNEISRQMPQLSPIIDSKQELQSIEVFLKEG